MLDYFLENGIKSVLFWVVGVAALWAGVSFMGLMPTSGFPHVDESKWQAVFLSNNQVYFGRLTSVDANYVALSHVYYLRTANDLENQSSGSLNLIKLGGEVHGPEDPIYIPKGSILFWENMKESSRVVQTINSSSK